MRNFRVLLSIVAILGCSLGTAAQDYRPFSPACVVDGGEVRPGFTAQYKYEGQWYVVGFCCTGCRTKFIQSPASYMATALAAVKAGSVKKEKKVSPDATGPCDLKKLVRSPWCLSCDRELGKEDVRNNLCKKCENKPVHVEFCVKSGMNEDRARVTYKCESCGATSEFESEFKHESGCKPKLGTGLKKVCSKSGMAPHATEVK
jgi:hypothetical protein